MRPNWTSAGSHQNLLISGGRGYWLYFLKNISAENKNKIDMPFHREIKWNCFPTIARVFIQNWNVNCYGLCENFQMKIYTQNY